MNHEIVELKKEIAQLKNLKQEFVNQYKALLKNQNNLLENFSLDKKFEKTIEEAIEELEETKENLEEKETWPKFLPI